jgi:hypothetical protein
VIQHSLALGSEHLQTDCDGAIGLVKSLDDAKLRRVVGRLIVQLADEDEPSPKEIRDDLLEGKLCPVGEAQEAFPRELPQGVEGVPDQQDGGE